MILLDTNVLSALMQREPPPAVIAWLDAQAPESLWISSVTLFEARYGIAVLADGRRKDALLQALESLVGEDLEHRVAAFDSGAAEHAVRLAADRKRAGRPVDLRDTFIAGIALAHGATLATRNTRHFEDLPAVVDPWG
ncbi:MAG: type II toxin-antitoxin system VapC family toxin [Candidatus Wenzhouxiangella sp. M2_3B_020]